MFVALAIAGAAAHAAARPSRSAGGHGILFVRAAAGSPNAFEGGSIYLWNPGSSPRRLTYGPDPRDQPRWSPTGKQIAFTMIPGWNGQGPCQAVGCRTEVWRMSPTGKNQKQLTTEGQPDGPAPNAVDATAPSWSPSGSRIVFQRDFGGSLPELVVVPASGGTETPVQPNADAPAWSAHGIAYGALGKGEETRLLDPKTSNSRLLFKAPVAYSMAWSPRGDRLAVIETTGSPGQSQTRIDLYSALGRHLETFRPLHGRAQACGVTWSPDERHLLLTLYNARHIPTGELTHLYLYEVAYNGAHGERLPVAPSTCSTSWR